MPVTLAESDQGNDTIDLQQTPRIICGKPWSSQLMQPSFPIQPLIALAVCFALLSSPGHSDSGLFETHFPGSTVLAKNEIDYDAVSFYTGKFASKFEAGETLELEGRVRNTMYQADENRSVLEVFRAYETGLASLGYETLYRCAGLNACGGSIGYALNRYGNTGGGMPLSDDFRYLVVERTTELGREVGHVLVMKTKRPVQIFVEAVQTEAEATELAILSADEIAAAIANRGTAAIYGLEFALDSAELLPESTAVLEQMAGYLKQAGDAQVLLVGHTDNQGTLDYNRNLSRQRAEAVRSALIDEFGIASNRLEAHGVGYLAPVAPNSSADGRARNRRVEMMLR